MQFLFHCDRYNNIRQQVTNDIIKKNPKFDFFNNTEKRMFLFNDVDTFICKKTRLLYMLNSAYKITL